MAHCKALFLLNIDSFYCFFAQRKTLAVERYVHLLANCYQVEILWLISLNPYLLNLLTISEKQSFCSVAKHFGIEPDELLIFQGSISNIPRELCLLLAHINTRLKIQDLAIAFSIGRTSASNALARIRRRIEESEKLQKDFKEIMSRLRPP